MPRPTFWSRLVRLNAPLAVAALRKLAEEVEALEPGAPALAVPVIFLPKGGPLMGQITVKDTDAPVAATVSFLDAKGSPTEPDDVPVWASSDESVATVQADADGKTATVTPGSPGAAEAATAQITVTSTDTDGTVVTSVGSVTVVSGEAVVGDVEFSAAPAPAPPGP